MRLGLFPGQGVPARVVQDALPQRDALLDAANEALGYDLRRRVAIAARRRGAMLPTSLAQPAIFAAGLVAWQAERADDYNYFAGHSLGEYAALVAGGALSFEDGLRIVKVRADAMQMAGRTSPGGMAAVLGLGLDQVKEIATQSGVEVANDNAPGQVVLSGRESNLAVAASMVRSARGRSVLLEAAGPFHTLAQASAAPALRAILDEVHITEPRVPVVSNVTARPYESADEIRDLLVLQLTNRVRFRESLEWLWSDGVREYKDMGPGEIVAGMALRTFKGLGSERAVNA